MSSPQFPPCPPQLKSVQHYIKLASDYEPRDHIISYWARLYALQTALKVDRKSPEAKALLTALMDWLEKYKKDNLNNEGVTSDVAGQAIVENEAIKLFSKADADDRASNFTKNVVKMFYTAGILCDVCEVFGELTEDITAKRKYAKWKATYIHNCLKNGEKPIPGPVGEEHDDFFMNMPVNEPQNSNEVSGDIPGIKFPTIPSETDHYNIPFDQNNWPPQQLPPTVTPQHYIPPQQQQMPTATPGLVLTPAHFAKAQKYCKYAISSMDYEDITTAIEYLQKSLCLLTIGKES